MEKAAGRGLLDPPIMKNAPEIKTPLPGPRARAIIERDRAVVSPSYTRGYPLVIERGAGSMVEDVDGNVFLDCSAGIAVNATGHSHPDVVKAITEQAGRFLHMSGTDFYYDVQVRLAEELAAIVPIRGGVKSFFGNSGTEAIEASHQAGAVCDRPRRPHRVSGRIPRPDDGIAGADREQGGAAAGVRAADAGRLSRAVSVLLSLPAGLTPEQHVAECLGYIENQLFQQLVSPDEIAAFVVEPIQGEGGYVVAPDQFLQGLRELTRKHGILLVVDEVQSGMGRTGRMFAIEHSGVEPDIVAIAKGIASGMPLGVASARADLMTWPPGAHASTFGGNPVSCAAALATLKLLQEKLVANAADVGAHLMAKLKALAEKHPLIGDVRGRGLMIGVELVRDRQTKERATDERNAVVTAAFARGLLILGAGKNSIRFSPPLVLTREQADIAVKILDEALTEVEGSRR